MRLPQAGSPALPSPARRRLALLLAGTGCACAAGAALAWGAGQAADPLLIRGLVAAAAVALVGAWHPRRVLIEGIGTALAVAGWLALERWQRSVPIPQIDLVSPLGVDTLAPLGLAALVLLAVVAWPGVRGASRWFCRIGCVIACAASLAAALVPQTYMYDTFDDGSDGAVVHIPRDGQLIEVRWDRDIAPRQVPIRWIRPRFENEWRLGEIGAGIGERLAPRQNWLRRPLWSAQRVGVAATLWAHAGAALLAVPILLLTWSGFPAWSRLRALIGLAPGVALALPWLTNLALLPPVCALAESAGVRLTATVQLAVGLLICGLAWTTSASLRELRS